MRVIDGVMLMNTHEWEPPLPEGLIVPRMGLKRLRSWFKEGKRRNWELTIEAPATFLAIHAAAGIALLFPFG